MNYSHLIEGVVVDTADPQEMGRLKVWCPSIDGDDPNIDNLPWALYVSPLAGQAHNYPAGNGAASVGPVSYGLWAIPKVGAQVIIAFLYGDYNQRVYMGSYFRDHGNRSLPAGRNVSSDVPTSDSGDALQPAGANLKAQFSNKLTASEAITRGAYERQVAQPADDKTPDEGYSNRVVTDKFAGNLDPQTYCITTPGRHSIIMQDDPAFARVRIKTAEGHQIILDDANERIYISTAGGRAWFEMDKDGHVQVYGAESLSMSAGGDFNLQALGNVNISAGKNVNIAAAGYARMSACDDISLSGDTKVNITSGGMMNLLAAADLAGSATEIHLNGGPAEEAECAEKPTIVPSAEPWTRPGTSGTRNKHWKA